MPDPELTSTAFADGAKIPVKYTGDGKDVSPPLAWSFLPEGTRSLALIVHDPDAPSGDFTHWVAWNIDPEPGGLGEGEAARPRAPTGEVRPATWDRLPLLAMAPHRYFHDLHALDSEVDLEPGASREQLEESLDGHVLGTAQLVGTYEPSET